MPDLCTRTKKGHALKTLGETRPQEPENSHQPPNNTPRNIVCVIEEALSFSLAPELMPTGRWPPDAANAAPRDLGSSAASSCRKYICARSTREAHMGDENGLFNPHTVDCMSLDALETAWKTHS
jgi:hypothetical protein